MFGGFKLGQEANLPPPPAKVEHNLNILHLATTQPYGSRACAFWTKMIIIHQGGVSLCRKNFEKFYQLLRRKFVSMLDSGLAIANLVI